ncbi:MAG: hypothetical protein ACK5LK_05410 [Chthoniobacterales bacterium]
MSFVIKRIRKIGAWILRNLGRYIIAPVVIFFARRASTTEQPIAVHMLVSSKSWKMALLAIFSFEFFTKSFWKLVIHDDGSLSPKIIEKIKKKLPGVRLILRKDADARVNEFLKNYPALQQSRSTHNLFLKFSDTLPFLETERFIILDSDLFFFAYPKEIMQWAESGDESCYYNKDTTDGYCINRASIEDATKITLWEHFNSGLLLMSRKAIDFDLSETFVSEFESRANKPQFFEQTLYALNTSAYNKGGALPPKYEISWNLWRHPDSVCRHYVGPFKFDNLFIEGPFTLFLRMTLPSLFNNKL